MLTLPDAIVPILVPLRRCSPTRLGGRRGACWVGAILAAGRRTVAAALRVMGHSDQCDCSCCHEAINRAVWSAREAARILLLC